MLAALEERFLVEPREDVGSPGFGSVVHTLNDLFLRGHEGQAQLVWITDGRSAGGKPRFEPSLWPERLEALNAAWSSEEHAGVLAALDVGLGLDDAALSDFIGSTPPDDRDRGGRILSFLQSLERDGTRTLQPHRVDTSPMMNCVFIPSDRSLRGRQLEAFHDFVTRQWGGDLVRLLRLSPSVTEKLEEDLTQRGQGSRVASLDEVLRLTYEQLNHSGRLVLEVPNPKQSGAQREIRVRVRRKGVRARLMPTYHASRPLARRLPDFLGSPFKTLRLLAAYETRYHAHDRALRDRLEQRRLVETDAQVREVVFESWVSIQLQLLQESDEPQRPYDALVLAGREAERLPLPALARDGAAAAKWYFSRK